MMKNASKFGLALGLFLIGLVFVAPSSATTLNYAGGTTLKNGLVGWWTMDSIGNKIADGSGNNNNGTNIGVTTAKGVINGAGKFDGSGSYIEANAIPLSRFSVGAWVNPSGIQTVQASVVADRFVATVNYAIAFDENTVNIHGGIYNGAWHNTPIATLPINTWTHVVTTYDGANIKLYINGVFSTSTAYSGPATSDNVGLRIGRRWDNPNIFNGLIDDVRIYNRALSASEIKQLYQLGGVKINKTDATRPDLMSGLVGWWTGDGKDFADATHIIDKSVSAVGTLSSGSFSKISGKIGQALSFNATNYITTPNTSSLQISDNLSIFAWIKPNYQGGYQSFASKQYSEYELGISGISDALKIYKLSIYKGKVGGGFEPTSPPSIPSMYIYAAKNQWHFVGVIISGSVATFYLDGNSATSTVTAGISTSTNLFSLGARPDATDKYSGGLDDVRIYNRALSPVEILELYSQGGGKINKTDVTRAQLLTGLAGWWTFDGKDFITAVTSTDRSGYGNNMKMIGTVNKVSGKIGQALSFDGSTNSYTVASPTQTVTGTFSVSVWVKPTGALAGWHSIFGTRQGGVSTYGFDFMIGNGSTIHGDISDGSAWMTTNANAAFTYQANQWIHIAYTINTTGYVIYANGLQVGSGTYTTSTPILFGPNTVQIGNSAGGYFTGTIDDVRIYNRFLSPTEVYQLYRMGK